MAAEGSAAQEHVEAAHAKRRALGLPDHPEVGSAATCDKQGCEKPMTGYDAWGQWCDEHNGGRDAARTPDCTCGVGNVWGVPEAMRAHSPDCPFRQAMCAPTTAAAIAPRVVQVPPSIGFPSEWDVVIGKDATEQVVASFESEEEAQACLRGYEVGFRHGTFAR